MIIGGLLALGALGCAARAGWVARQRRRKFGEGFALGLFLGPIGIHLATMLPRPSRGNLDSKDRDCFLMIASFGESTARFARCE